MDNITLINAMLRGVSEPRWGIKDITAQYVAEDEDTDAEFVIFRAGQETDISIQIARDVYCVNRWDAENGVMYHLCESKEIIKAAVAVVEALL